MTPPRALLSFGAHGVSPLRFLARPGVSPSFSSFSATRGDRHLSVGCAIVSFRSPNTLRAGLALLTHSRGGAQAPTQQARCRPTVRLRLLCFACSLACRCRTAHQSGRSPPCGMADVSLTSEGANLPLASSLGLSPLGLPSECGRLPVRLACAIVSFGRRPPTSGGETAAPPGGGVVLSALGPTRGFTFLGAPSAPRGAPSAPRGFTSECGRLPVPSRRPLGAPRRQRYAARAHTPRTSTATPAARLTPTCGVSCFTTRYTLPCNDDMSCRFWP